MSETVTSTLKDWINKAYSTTLFLFICLFCIALSQEVCGKFYFSVKKKDKQNKTIVFLGIKAFMPKSNHAS